LIGNEGFINKHHITFHGYDTDENSGSMTFHNLTEKKDGEKSDDSPTFEKDDFQSSSDDEVVENPNLIFTNYCIVIGCYFYLLIQLV
jgi:hypothetical protein